MDSIYKILESLDQVSENKESGVKITNIKWKDPEAKLPTSLKLNITAPSGSSNEKIYDLIHAELKDEHGEADDFDFQFEESKTTQDGSGPWYKEQRAKEAYEKANPGKRWADLPYGYKEDWRTKTESVEEAEITPIDHSDEEDGASVEDIASAITRRMMAHPKFGALVREVDIIDLNDAIEDIAQFHEGGDLGTSDVSNMVNDVLKQLGKPDALKEEEVEENAFNQAAADAARAGKKEFEFDGKTYPVKMDKDTAEKLDDDINESEDSMPASPDEGGMAGDQIEFIKYAADEIKDHIEAGGDFPEWFQNKMSDVYGKMKDLHGYMEGDKRNDADDEVEFELEERKLSSSEEQEMERIVTAMKDDPETVKDMKERYGKRWKEVAYATATKMAKQHGKGTGKKKKTESTVAGAVATSTGATGEGIYGNPSIYENFNSQVENMITESMDVTVNSSNDPNAKPSITVNATGEDAMALAQLLQLAAVPKKPCEMCGGMHEGECMREDEEANSANNTHTYDMQYLLNAISGGLNGQKRQINPNNPGDNPLAMQGIGKNSLNLEESENDISVSHLESLYKEFKAK